MSRFVADLGGRMLAVAVLVIGCTHEQVVMQTGLPGARAAAELSLVKERGDYLDVRMESGGFSYRFFLPADEACRAMLVDGQAVTYANVGPFGRLQAGDTVCDPVGVLSLAAWRDRGPRRSRSEVIPRSRADLDERIYVDDDLTLVRGRYRLAGLIGFVGGADSIAVIPSVPECRDLAIPGTASMEFRDVGEKPYVLVEGGRLCPVIGFVQPPPNP